MEQNNYNLFNFENNLCIKSIAKTNIKTEINLKCGEIYLNKNKLFLLCLYCDQNNLSLKEFQEHIFEKHFSGQNYVPYDENVCSESDENMIDATYQEKNEALYKKSDTIIIPILAKRKSPNIFQLNWKKFCQKKKELTNKIYEQTSQDDKLKLSNEQCFNYESHLMNNEESFLSHLSSETNQVLTEVSKENIKNNQPFENELLSHLHIFESCQETDDNNDKNQIVKVEFSENEINIDETIFQNNSTDPEILQQDFQDSDISSYSTKHDDGFFYCPKCPKFYRRFETLKNHYRYHTGEKNPFDCPVCQKSFSAKCRLEAHYRIHSNERPFPCHMCNRAFRQKQKLKHHLESHEKGTIKDMSNPYHNPASLPILINNQTIGAENTKTTDGLYQCPLCCKYYKRFDSLKEHAEIHIEGLEHNCPICQKTLKTYRSLKKHIMLLHQNENISLSNEIFNLDTNEMDELTVLHESNDSRFLEEQNSSNDISLKEVIIDQGEDENVIEELYCKICKVNFKQYESYINHCSQHRFKYI